MIFTNNEFKIVNYEYWIKKKHLYFDEQENYSLYISYGNIGAYAGANFEDGIGAKTNFSAIQLGLDTPIIDANIDFLTVGATAMYKDGSFYVGIGTGLIGYSFSVNIIKLYDAIFGSWSNCIN